MRIAAFLLSLKKLKKSSQNTNTCHRTDAGAGAIMDDMQSLTWAQKAQMVQETQYAVKLVEGEEGAPVWRYMPEPGDIGRNTGNTNPKFRPKASDCNPASGPCPAT